MKYLEIVKYFRCKISDMSLEDAKWLCFDIFRYDPEKHPDWQEMLEEIEDKAALLDHITVDLERPINAFLLIWATSYRPNQYISSNQELTDDIYKSILCSELIAEDDKKIIKTVKMENHFSDADYYAAEEIANELLKEDNLPVEVVNGLIRYFKNTRRYYNCESLYQKFKNDILSSEYNDAIERKNHYKKEYKPIKEDKIIKYSRFMSDYLNINVHRQVRPKRKINDATDVSENTNNAAADMTSNQMNLEKNQQEGLKIRNGKTKFSSYLRWLKGDRKHKEVAEALGINQTSYNAILNGKKDKYASVTITANLCKIFGIEPEKLGFFGHSLNKAVLAEINKRNYGFDYEARRNEIFKNLSIVSEADDENSHAELEQEPDTLSLQEKCNIRKRIDMKELKDYNFTLEEIASLYNVTRERIRQLISNAEVSNYTSEDLEIDDQVYFNGALYNDADEIISKYFPNLNHDYIDSSISQFIIATGESFNVAVNYLYFKINQKKYDYSRIFYKNKVFRGIGDLSRTFFPKDDPDRIREHLGNIVGSLGYDLESAIDYLISSIDQLRYNTKVYVDGIEYESKIDAIRKLFPDYDENKIRDCVSQRMSRMSFEDAIKYTLENPPGEKKPFIYKHRVYPSKINAIAQIFPDRDPQNTYYTIHSYMSEHECSFEQAVDAIQRYGYRNKRIAVKYNGKEYSSLRELCRDYDIDNRALSDYMKRHHVTAKAAMNHFLGLSETSPEQEKNYEKPERKDIATTTKQKPIRTIDDGISLKYKGKKYTSLCALCEEYKIEPDDVRRWEKKFNGNLKRAVDYCVEFYSIINKS